MAGSEPQIVETLKAPLIAKPQKVSHAKRKGVGNCTIIPSYQTVYSRP